MCPEPALLVAYLDGTLFHRDARAVDEHLLTCASCTALLADMRRQREAEAYRSRRSQARMIGLAVAAVAVVAIGVWAVMPGAKDEAARPAVADPGKGGSDQSAISAKTEDPPLRPAAEPVPPALEAKVREKTPPKPKPKPVAKETAVKTGVQPARSADVVIPAEDGAIVLRGRNANRRFVWRARDLVIEYSTDGGATWVTEHTADHSIRAGAFVNSNVAWLVGENGLVLRRTVNGWFGTSAPAEGHIVAVRASSPSQATVTLDDGRVFNTVNGGVTWSAP